MSKIGIISGGGSLPLIIGENLIQRKYKICFFCIKNYSNKEIYNNYENIEIELYSFSKILSSLKSKNVDKIIFAGKIDRPTLKDIKFDFKTITLIKDYFLEKKGDDKLLLAISNLFLKYGFPLFDWKKECDILFASNDYLTKKKPKKISIQNMNKALEVFKIFGKADIGQSLIVQNQLILGIECIEGTDKLIERCYKYKKSGDNGILVKLSKYNQHTSLDLPTIGLNTVKNLKKFQYAGLYIEKNKCIIIEKEKVINFCNQNNLFLSTVEKID